MPRPKSRRAGQLMARHSMRRRERDQLPGSFRESFNLALQPFAKLMKTVEVELYFTIVYSRLPETVHSWDEWIGLK
jgi:hypothetical protein